MSTRGPRNSADLDAGVQKGTRVPHTTQDDPALAFVATHKPLGSPIQVQAQDSVRRVGKWAGKRRLAHRTSIALDRPLSPPSPTDDPLYMHTNQLSLQYWERRGKLNSNGLQLNFVRSGRKMSKTVNQGLAVKIKDMLTVIYVYMDKVWEKVQSGNCALNYGKISSRKYQKRDQQDFITCRTPSQHTQDIQDPRVLIQLDYSFPASPMIPEVESCRIKPESGMFNSKEVFGPFELADHLPGGLIWDISVRSLSPLTRFWG
ncbi:hypothetical protein B0H14DRAFT_2584658 [Mycena olivaceomarginata]|nr:hypothetical protein B0H14DRAFT_2584658 [Mycena olivaceomarginata]